MMKSFSHNGSIDRQPAVAGRFYASDKSTLEKDLSEHFKGCRKPAEVIKANAIVVPHAGYIFSGNTAASGFLTTDHSGDYDNIFIIGTSHTARYSGASVYTSGNFITPLGAAKVNSSTGNSLRRASPLFCFNESPHFREHSLEVQVPFIQYYYASQPGIVPILIGTEDTGEIKEMAAILKPWFNERNLFIISSDFSHYPSYEDAKTVDEETVLAFSEGNRETFLKVIGKLKPWQGLQTRMCGWSSGLLLLELAGNEESGSFRKIDYSNSGDSHFGSRDGVVGYSSIAYVKEKTESQADRNVYFSTEEISILFSTARRSIEAGLSGERYIPADITRYSEKLRESSGAFVTIKINGELRGCIGRYPDGTSLIETVAEMAYSSAFSDYRFEPLNAEEYKKCKLEISIIGQLKKINSTGEIKRGLHGIYIKKGMRAGTMLPQVAVERGWTVEEFLGYTARDKAGIGWDGWKDAELFIYDTIVLDEER